jgi:selenide,water dikinase
LATVPRWADENVLVGFDTADDAGVYKLTPELCPGADGGFLHAHCRRSVHLRRHRRRQRAERRLRHGRPPHLRALHSGLAAERRSADLAQILKGGAEKMHEAGCSILGGHSVADDEIKFGYAVTGTVHPARVKANAGARPGDALVFTKRLGTGVIATALKRGIARPRMWPRRLHPCSR